MGTQRLGYKSKCEDKSSNDDTKEEETGSPDSPIPFQIRDDLPDFNKMLEGVKSTRKRRKRNVVEESHEKRTDKTSDHKPVSKWYLFM